jgi:hypothetical protein
MIAHGAMAIERQVMKGVLPLVWEPAVTPHRAVASVMSETPSWLA